jgi:Zn-dependent M28 family amino/carboxypeptidase
VDRHDVRYLHNVVARIQGTDSTGVVLFVSHAESVPQGPGAGDNATGAATLVEMTRALAAGEPLRNDIIILVEDGEERGFLGGRALADSHPWMADGKVAVGLDTAAWGPPYVIQISGDDGLLVRAYADGVGTPLADGFIASEDPYAEYETFPFRSRGIPAIEIEDTYANVDQHSARDTVDQVDPGRVQQLCDQALGLTDLTDASTPGRVFHTVPGLGVVHYPVTWDALLVALVLVGFAAVGVRGAGYGADGSSPGPAQRSASPWHRRCWQSSPP